MTIEPFYCTRETLKDALDVAETARTNAQIDRQLASATEAVDGQLCRGRMAFSLLDTTRYYDWPVLDGGGAWRLWLDDGPWVSVSSVSVAGVAINSSNYYLLPLNEGPPFVELQILRNTGATFAGSSTPQKAVAITGTAGYRDDRVSAGALNGAVNASVTTWTLTDGSVAGVGDLLVCESERAVVAGRTWVDSGQTLAGGGLASSNAGVALTPSGLATAFAVGEQLTIDSEVFDVVDIVGSALRVRRAADGSVLAAHTAGAAINVKRGYTVVRGCMGTTAASHSDTTAVQVHRPPQLVRELCLAEAITGLLSAKAGYSRSMRLNSDSAVKQVLGTGLDQLRAAVVKRHGKQMRVGAV